MTSFLVHIRTAWNDYFPGTSPTNLNPQTYTSRQTRSDTYLYVRNCLFNGCTSTSEGGALYCTSVTYLLIESTSFFSCNSSSSGGAIYFYNSNGQCVLHEVCGYDCFSTNSFHNFAYISVNNAVSSKNYVNYSSITRCLNDNSYTWHTLRLEYGKICCLSNNISTNRCYSRSGICCEPFSDSNSVTCSLSYTTFADNNATSYVCIRLTRTGANFEFKSCNIIRNTQVSFDSEGTIYANGNVIIDDSCIVENKAKYIFKQQSSSYTITLSNCTVDSTSNYGSLIIQNTVTKSFVVALKHMSTQNCQSQYDSTECPAPIIQHCKTAFKSFYRPQLSDFFSLHGIIFYFIY
jgi:hypothetical protein